MTFLPVISRFVTVWRHVSLNKPTPHDVFNLVCYVSDTRRKAVLKYNLKSKGDYQAIEDAITCHKLLATLADNLTMSAPELRVLIFLWI
jgi:hypothetical protein